jgi:hypothetical protein
MTQTSVVLQARAPREIYGAARYLVTGPAPIPEIFSLRKSETMLSSLRRRMKRIRAGKPTAGERSGKRLFWPGGQRNRLKGLNSDEEIQGNPSFFL